MPTSVIEEYELRLSETLPQLRERIESAARGVGRDSADVRLVAVTKGHPIEAIHAALAAGLRDLGENRIGELEAKRSEFGPSEATWHFIGHIQSRKAARAVQAADLIHSIDSVKLARKISAAAETGSERVPVLVQVNTSGEGAKGGLEGSAVVETLHEIAEFPGLEVRGLMTMAPFVHDERILKATFGGLRELLTHARAVSSRIGPELSMGMTNDLEVAIREGSTMVRIGTALFGERAGA